MTRAATRPTQPGRRQAGAVGPVSVLPEILGHGSGVDDLIIFLFPVVLGIGFWLITRHKPDEDQDDELDDDELDDPTERG